MRKKILTVFFMLPMLGIAQELPYKNPHLTPQERAEDLLHRMTLDEKIAQLQCIWTENKKKLFTGEEFDESKATLYYKDGLGFISRPNENLFPEKPAYHPALHPRQAAELYNKIQRYFVENTRLGIPVVAHDEVVHGQLSQDATCFPVPIALSCSWDEELIREIFTVAAKEARSKGGSEGLGPVLDVVHDPRWGRTEEMMGEDPYLISRLGCAAVSGLQGKGEYIGWESMGATLKHLGVHGASEGGNNTAPSFVDEHEARQTFFFPFREVIRKCNPMYMMFTYNEIWGRPAHANKYLLQDILREEFRFEGTNVSDYGGISNLHYVDKISPTLADAAIQAINAGIDAEFPNPDTYPTLKQSLQEGKVSMDVIDRAVKNVLISKFRLGLFEHPYVDVEKAEAINGCEAHRQVAYRAATESMVLLKNDNNFLPLDKNKVKTIALIGPNADRCILGGYSGAPRDTISPLRAIREKQGDKMNILYSEGVRITDHHSPFPPIIKAYTYEDNARKIHDAVEMAKKADIVVLFVGSNEGTSREAYGPEAPGDLPTLELLAGQKELIDQIVAIGKPTCAFVNSGTTLSMGELESKIPAVMQCWYLGQEGGYAMIDALFGDVNPSGKLSISFPHSAGHIPAYYNYKPASRRGYNLGFDVTPLHPFGYGLSYTTYAYCNLRIDKSVMSEHEIATVSIDVQNIGNRDGSEIVQMYITDDYASLTRPVKELKGFKRIHLKAGEKQTVTFKVDKDALAYYDMNNKWQVEPGTFTIAVGPSSDKNDKIRLEVK
jgi:beta-glucosidase